jgi:hypothetical protein
MKTKLSIMELRIKLFVTNYKITMMNTIKIIAIFLILSGCSSKDLKPLEIQGVWYLESLNFIVGGKEYVTSKNRLDKTDWLNVKWEFLQNGDHNVTYNTSISKGKYLIENNTVSIFDKYNVRNDFTIKKSNGKLEFNSINVDILSLNGKSEIKPEAEVLSNVKWFLSDQLTELEIHSANSLQMKYIFTKK